MKKRQRAGWVAMVCGALLATVFAGNALAHHSFAMYDQTKTLVLTGVAHQYIAQASHAELHFYLIGPDGELMRDKDGKLQDWGVELAGAAEMAKQGVTADSFPAGTIFSIKMNPLRDGRPFGSRVGTIAKCPWKTPPAPGKTCDTVKGSEIIGGTTF